MILKRRLILKSLTILSSASLLPIIGCSDKGSESTPAEDAVTESDTNNNTVEPAVESMKEEMTEAVDSEESEAQMDDSEVKEEVAAESEPEPMESNEPSSADESSRVSEDEPSAVALNYVHDATTSKSRTNTDAVCKTCQFYTGEADWGPCTIFSGREVSANGWCSAWSMKA